jgi:hypothetical protein
MEQNNLIVTPDGKSWDEVTRDTSYITSDICLVTQTDADAGEGSVVLFKQFRGGSQGWRNKDFAIAYDRFICLKDGAYRIMATTQAQTSTTGNHAQIYINGTFIHSARSGGDDRAIDSHYSVEMKQGDYVQIKGLFDAYYKWNKFIIERIH